MNFRPETLRLFIGIFISGAGILFFNASKIAVHLSENQPEMHMEMVLSAVGSLFLLMLLAVLLRDLSNKGG